MHAFGRGFARGVRTSLDAELVHFDVPVPCRRRQLREEVAAEAQDRLQADARTDPIGDRREPAFNIAL
jgi:hypothetical protein